MAATRKDFPLNQGDEPYVTMTATENGVARNFQTSSDVVEVVVKATQDTADSAAITTLSSAGVSPKITLTGTNAVVDFSGLLSDAGSVWYRARIKAGGSSGRKRSFLLGYVAIEAS